ncbi:hypothetical protein NDU88_007223 [Pleurodeles waltl]|uniref:Secreted protein n=1 Tax=Pleurodeles waltl TaxID=8319 RepID=A0AAV7SRX4_PLEWA|nr:hypothetical protein NDU88_007223 [Pleurodeles waltl]
MLKRRGPVSPCGIFTLSAAFGGSEGPWCLGRSPRWRTGDPGTVREQLFTAPTAHQSATRSLQPHKPRLSYGVTPPLRPGTLRRERVTGKSRVLGLLAHLHGVSGCRSGAQQLVKQIVLVVACSPAVSAPPPPPQYRREIELTL